MEENRRKYNGSNISEKTREKLSKRKLATAKRNREKYNGSARSPEHENKRMKSIKKYFDENRKKYNGYAVSNELREKFSKNSLGRKHTEKTKNKLSNIFSGENNPSYGTHMSKEDKIKNVLLNHKRDLLKTNTSGFVGLKKYNGKKGIKWQVVYKYNKKAYYLGTYDTKLEAAKAYDDKMIELFGVEAASNKNLGLY